MLDIICVRVIFLFAGVLLALAVHRSLGLRSSLWAGVFGGIFGAAAQCVAAACLHVGRLSS